MLQAFQIMLMTVVIAAITGFFISLLIQILCHIVHMKGGAQNDEDNTMVALAIAVALDRSRKQG